MLFALQSYAVSVHLINDSPYDLVAEIQTATGRILGNVSLSPGKDIRWNKDISTMNQSESITPLIVAWKCAYGGYYSVCSDVSVGASVSASLCDGSKSCRPNPKQDNKDQN